MQALLLLAFIIAIIALVQARLVWLAAIVLLIMLADLFGGAIAKFFGFLGATANVIGETASEEAAEVEAAKTKPPAGKKFIDEGLSRIGKEAGKKEVEKKEGKRMKSKLSVTNVVGAIDNFMMGFGKLFRR